jgi:hypothetical protein
MRQIMMDRHLDYLSIDDERHQARNTDVAIKKDAKLSKCETRNDTSDYLKVIHGLEKPKSTYRNVMGIIWFYIRV